MSSATTSKSASTAESESVLSGRRRPKSASGPQLVARVMGAVERELERIEALIGDTAERTEVERAARTLASLARTLAEIMRLRREDDKVKREDDDAVPRDLQSLRLELARRLERLVGDAKAAHPDPAE